MTSPWSLRFGLWCLILENTVMLGGSQSSHQGLQIKEEILYLLLLLDIFVNTDIKARPAYLDRGDSHPAVVCTTGHFSTKTHYKHTITTHTLTYTNLHAHNPSCPCTHKHTVPVETVFPVHSPSPLFPSSARGFA